MVKRYPHSFNYYPASGSTQGGEYLPGVEAEPVPFHGRIVFKPQVVKNADGSMSEIQGKIHCRPLDADIKKGEKIVFGTRSLKVFQTRKGQLAWVVWVE